MTRFLLSRFRRGAAAVLRIRTDTGQRRARNGLRGVARGDGDGVLDLVAGMYDDLVALGQAAEHLGLQAVVAADRHRPQDRPALLGEEHGPLAAAVAEQRPVRYLQHVL